MSKGRFIFGMILSSIFGGLIVLIGLGILNENGINTTHPNEPVVATTRFEKIPKTSKDYIVPEGINFIKASGKVVPAVVHITNSSSSSSDSQSSWGRFFGDRRLRQSTGSGVIISEDGYIATNYHVVEDATELEVRLDDNRRVEAEVIGVDADTDLALIKIDAGKLPYVKFGNSDQVRVGEWVLAVGNPFDLNNTVTAGIISAKARNINLISSENRYGIESFLQTDAVVNRGNSGGALVNLEGELIGINTAIATNTGNFNGYSFAVPSILIKKVMDDLLEFGIVQRGLLGVTITDADGRLTDELSGVLIRSVADGSAADDAGLRDGDVIIGVEGKEIRTTAELQEMIARNRPGDQVLIRYKRSGKSREVNLTLKSISNSTEVVVKEIPISFEIEGAKFEEVSARLKGRLDVSGGAQITELGTGAWEQAGIKEGFVITKIGEESVDNIRELERIVASKSKDFYVLGKYPNGDKEYYRVEW